MYSFDVIRDDDRVDAIGRLLGDGRGAVIAEGLWGSCAPILAAILAERLNRPLLLVTAHSDEADDFRDDIETATGRAPELFPALEALPGEPQADDELIAERLRLCLWLAEEYRRPAGASEDTGPGIGDRGSGEVRTVSEREAPASAAPNKVPPRARTPHASRSGVRPGTQSTIQNPKSRIAAPPPIIVAPIQALMQPVPTPAAIAEQSRLIRVGATLSIDDLTAWLTARGFTRCEQVETPGDFAVRGGIIDIFSHAQTDPVRVELFGDEVESIRLFEASTQRSATTLESIRIPAMHFDPDPRAITAFTAYLPADAIIAFNEPLEIQELGRTYWQRLGERAGMTPADAVFRRANDFAQLHLQRFRGGDEARTVALDVHSLPQFETGAGDAVATLRELAEGTGTEAGTDAGTEAGTTGDKCDIVVLCDNAPEEERFRELLEERHEGTEARRHEGGVQSSALQDEAHRRPADRGEHRRPAGANREIERSRDREIERSRRPPSEREAPASAASESAIPRANHLSEREAPASAAPKDARTPATPADAESKIQNPKSKIRTAVGVIHRGFRWGRTAFVPHHEVFHRYRQRRTLRRVAPARPIDSFFDLNAGDYVVHLNHGIGRFTGLTTLERDGKRGEYLAIRYANDAVIHVPVSQIDLVQKYIGGFRGRPVLSKLGGTSWKRTKERVADAIGDLAADLLAVQAKREVELGIPYPADTNWQREFEGSFIYTETQDQLRALEEIKTDLRKPRPMDRLLCGDVGYGKTELSMRAAFKVVEYGKQVAVLVPTTVLAEQHYNTFRERMADYPFVVEVLSRFRTKAEQNRIIAAARRGQVDILIGTHRLLSKDVKFADLGLVVIDEEQRFGVEAKERLKSLRATVEVLTMTATPIPRTLHMAMLGIKDISSLATPPLDRRSIVTQVRMWDDKLIKEAVLRELNRDGQVYFVHNFVRDIQRVADHIKALVPEARIAIGHGQMPERELEDVMLRFMRREADILVCTTIIESGIDNPAANTMFVNRAERFGLADLHQLRGRVGRARRRAYAYMLLSPKHAVNPNAAKRLKAIEHYSQIGAGFQIAMRDLEIRGAGNILGPEQSGHIEAVGYELYCQLLERAVKRMRNEPVRDERPVNLDLGISASIPKSYIRADRQRMEVYKRLTRCASPEEIAVVERDIRDAFGPPPEQVQTLLQLAEIRALASPWGIRSIVLDPPDVVFTITDLPRVEALFAEGPGSPRIPDATTIHWRLPARYLEKATLLAVLRKQLARPQPAARQPAATA